MQREVSFYISLSDQEVNNKESIQFCAVRNMTTPYLTNLSSDANPLSEYKPSSFYKVQVTSLSLVGYPTTSKEKVKSTSSTTSSINAEASDYKIRPCLVCGVTVTVNNPSQLRTLENVWAASTDLASSSSLVRAMNSVNSAASDTLDIMKVAGDRCIPSRLHYLVLYDFHHKATTTQPIKEDNSKESKTKKTLSGTGTSASSNGGRQESLYQELFLGKFLYEVPVIEDVDSDIVGIGPHYDGIFPTIDLTASSSNGIYSTPIGITAPTTSNPYDSNFNPISSSAHFASTSNLTTMNKKSLDLMKITKAEPVVVKTLAINAPDSLHITYISPSKDGRHLYVAMCSLADNDNSTEPSLHTNQMDVDDESDFFPQKSYMYWDNNDTQSGKLMNDETHSNGSNTNALLLVYALDFSGSVVKVMSEPLVKRELPLEQAPIEHVLLPLQEKQKCMSSSANFSTNSTSNSTPQEPVGQVALVCKDGVVRLLNLNTLKTVTEARLEGKKFISATYCNSKFSSLKTKFNFFFYVGCGNTGVENKYLVESSVDAITLVYANNKV